MTVVAGDILLISVVVPGKYQFEADESQSLRCVLFATTSATFGIESLDNPQMVV